MTMIDTTAALAAFCERAAAHPFIAIDTEFMREKTFWPQLCLVQIASPEEDAAIDPLADGIDLSPLFALLANERVVKVFHAARQDVEIFHHLSGATPKPLFDSQVAAMVCGFGESVGYDTLMAKLVGARIDKSQRFADWSARPLSAKQLSYALSDVTHLRDAYPLLKEKLEVDDRGAWVAEEMAALTDPALYESPPAEAWRRLKPKTDDRRFLARLQALAAWREETAQAKDVPRSRVVRDESLIDIAANAPKTADAMARARGVSQGLAEGKHGQAMLAALEQAAALAEDALPTPPPRGPRQGAGPLGDLLKVLLKLRADDHDVAQRLIASGQDIDRIAEDDEADTPVLKGWRRRIFGEDALALKRGELALSALGGRIHLIRVTAEGAQELANKPKAPRRRRGGRRKGAITAQE